MGATLKKKYSFMKKIRKNGNFLLRLFGQNIVVLEEMTDAFVEVEKSLRTVALIIIRGLKE
jgi:hypothetical protein